MSARAGPFEIVREIAAAPGLVLLEGQDVGGERRLLQVARLRAPKSDDERAARTGHERVLAQQTAELITDADLVVHAHGGCDSDAGERMLFWALPWSDAPFVLERAKEKPLSTGELVRIGVSLAERMALRHTWGRVDPLLSEHVIRIGPGGKAEIASVPVAVESEWLAPGMLPARVAPEERDGRDPKPSGDLWRLGQLLQSLSLHLESASSELERCIGALTAENVENRTADAGRALAMLERLAESTRAHSNGRMRSASSSKAASESPSLDALPDPHGLASWDTSAETRAAAPLAAAAPLTPDDATASGRSHPTLGHDVAALERAIDVDLEAITRRARALLADSAPEAHVDSEAVTRQAEPETPVPKAPGSAILIDHTIKPEAVAFASAPYEPLPVADTIVEPARTPEGVLSMLRVVDAEGPQPTERIDADAVSGALLPAPVIFTDRASIDDRARSASEARDPKRAGSAKPDEAIERPKNGQAHAVSIDPIAAAWQQPVLPSGESPWSEVVQPRGTHRRARADFPGFSDELPVPAPSRGERRAQAYDAGSDYESGASYTNIPTSEIEVEIAAALRGAGTRKVVSSVLILLVIFGLFALLSRSTPRSDARHSPLLATPANEVTLDSDPPLATIVSEADGALLGRAPLTFLVAPGTRATVYLALPDREPVRLVLPDRGGLTAKLAPLADPPCVVALTVREEVDLEGVNADIGPGPERRIPGAAVVRVKAGESVRGARLVLCPSRGGAAEQALDLERGESAVPVRVTAPEGATAYLNGDPIGTVPAVGHTSAAFSRVRVDDVQGVSEERLVVTQAETEVRMPIPKHRPSPVVLAPDSDERAGPDLALALGEAEGVPLEGDFTDPATAGDVSVAGEARSSDEGKTEDGKIEEGRSGEDAKGDISRLKLTKAQRGLRAKRLLKSGTKSLLGGRIQKARDALIECVEIDPTAAECHRTLGALYRRARSTHKAREHFNRYLELAPEAPDADRIRKILEQ